MTRIIDDLVAARNFSAAENVLAKLQHAPWVVAVRGDVAYAKGDHETAVELYRDALAEGVTDVALRLGNLLAEAGDQASAEEIYRQAADQGEPMGWRNLALSTQESNASLAEDYFRRAIHEGDQRSGLLLGELLADLGRHDDALEVLSTALACGEGEAAIALGLILKERGQRDEAEAVFKRGMDAGSGEAVAPFLGNLLSESGRAGEAEALYRAAVTANIASPDSLLNLGNLLADRSDKASQAEAEKLYRRAAAAGLPEAMTNLGILLEEQGRISEAQVAYRAGSAAGDGLAARRLAELARERD